MKKIIHNQKGYIALIAVLIIVAVTLSIGLSLNILSIGESRSGLLAQQSAASFALADSCLREALLRLERDSDYAGGSLNTGQGSCIINITNNNPQFIISVQSDASGVKRKLEAAAVLAGEVISLDYWRELNE